MPHPISGCGDPGLRLGMHRVSELLVPGVVVLSCCAGQDASGLRDSCISARWIESISTTKFKCSYFGMLVFRFSRVIQYFFVF